MPYAEVNDIRMYHEEMGSGTPLLLMHGATGSIDGPDLTRSGGWSDLARTLACVGANYHNDALVEEANEFVDLDALEREHPE